MFCPDCMGTGEAFPCVPCDRCHATGELPDVETDCTITGPNGQTFESGGAVVTPDRAIAYLSSDPVPEITGMIDGKPFVTRDGWRAPLTDWHGNQIGLYYVTSRRRNPPHYWQRHTYYIRATIDGIDYYGQTQGPGMAVSLRAYKHQ